MIIFKSKDSSKEHYKGFLIGFNDMSDIDGIYWAVDELGFSPYDLVFAYIDTSLVGAVCWHVAANDDYDPDTDNPADEYTAISVPEISENLISNLHDKAEFWAHIERTGEGFNFKWVEVD